MATLRYLPVVSIHAPNEGSDFHSRLKGPLECVVSIHAPNEGSDVERIFLVPHFLVSIHAPNEGSDIFWQWMTRWV